MALVSGHLLGTEDLNSKTLATYFQELNFNIIEYCEKKYLVQFQYFIDFESEIETSNKDRQKLKQYSRTTPNTPILQKTTAKHLQTSEQETNVKLPLSITLFPISLAQPQIPSSPLIRFSRIEDFQSPKSPIQQQESLLTSTNRLDFLTENQSEHSETASHDKNNSELSEKEEESIHNESEEDEMTAYIAKIPEFNGEDIETSPQEWLDQVTKAEDANGWNAARMLRTIPYFLKGTAGKWFENLTTLFNDWTAFKTVFLEQFTNNNTSITFWNRFRNIKQEPSKSVMIYIGKFNKLLRQIRQLETNDYYFNAQILDQFITGLKNKLIKKIHPHVPEDLNSAIQHAKKYEMAMEEANHTKLVNLTIRKTSSAAEEKIDQLTKKLFNNTRRTEFLQYCTFRRIAENANLSDIFSFEFETNESPFLLSNVTANEQKAITAMYTKAEIEGKPIRLILNNGFAEIIVTTDSIKKTPVGEIDNFLFTIDRITIPVKTTCLSTYHLCGKWDETPCLTCGKQLLDKCDWINVVFRGGVCDQTCQYALFIAEKVKHGTPFDAAYNSALNKLYHYLHDAKMIYKLAMVLINRGTKEDVFQMKKAEYIEYTLELAGFDYKDEVEEYYQIANHSYPTQEAQIQ
ncbi:hypothetical protein G9A89_005313 [Geosiphon pyriformis]|nr:hypothetical protein G9A89_005313 [Geosiphon pyriformis]